MDEPVTIERRRLLLDDFFQVEEVFFRHELPGGRMSAEVRRLNLERGDSAAALVVNRDRRVCILTRQFRYPAYKRGQRWSVEVPAGVVEQGESAVESIRREIREEIGYRVCELAPIATFFPSPGGSSERIHLFLALVRDRDRVAPGGGSESENEDIETLEIPLDDVDRFSVDVEVGDAKTMIALNWLQLRVARGEPLWENDHE